MLGRFGYSVDESLRWAYVQPKFAPSSSSRLPAYEQAGSEYLFVATAVGLNRLVSRDGTLDIRLIGLVHLAAFLAAFAFLLKVTRPAVWIVALVIFTDVGYAAYWNSFYTEPASCIFLLLLLAESFLMLGRRVVEKAALARWCLWAALLVWAKSSNYPVGILLALFGVRLAFFGKGTRAVGIAGACAIAAITWVTMATRPVPMQFATTYNAIFMGILPDSKDRAGDLASMGLDPKLADYSGTGAWTPRSAFGDLVNQRVSDRVTAGTVARFYLEHPGRIWTRAGDLMPQAFSLRPEWCGNFEKSAGRAAGAKTGSFTLWSFVHERVFGGMGRMLLIALGLIPVGLIGIWVRRPDQRLRIEFMGLLCACALIAFLTAALGDAWDNVKHLFLFNLLLDSVLISGVQLARIEL